MMKVRTTGVDFKIVPDESNYIIGSNSKETIGELYTFDIELAISKPESIRSKRLMDILVAIFLLITYPFQLVFVKKPIRLLRNILSVIFGHKSWVGFSDKTSIDIAKIKAGVLTTTSGLDLHLLDLAPSRRLDMLYAKEYKAMDDFSIIAKNYSDLGS
jgi:hypothetical protein